MRTVKLDVFEEQHKWLLQHSKADRLVCDADGRFTQAIYYSPLKQWEGMITPDGTVNVPDMDCYNALTDEGEMLETLNELRQQRG